MARLKIDYGIDLGTTNSAIARIDNGEVKILKNKAQMDTLPSLVYFDKNKKGVLSTKIGLNAANAMKQDDSKALKLAQEGKTREQFGYAEFKRDMGTDKIFSNSNMPKESYTPEELSAEVLKELIKVVNDEHVSSCVVTVPAKFTANQKEATMKAAKIAGITQCELLQEPVAACMAYGMTTDNKSGYWMVFDFGGGTFDAALVKAEDGILTVFDTEGDNYLGGKNLDNDVVNKILLPHIREEYNIASFDSQKSTEGEILRIVLKSMAEEIRKELSFTDSMDFSSYDRDIELSEDDDGNDIEIDITVTSEDLKDALTPTYQKAIDICKELLSRNKLTGNDLSTVILVGGPTLSPIVREMLKTQITDKIETKTDPMTAVAKGAALYASTIDAIVDEEAVKAESSEQTVFIEIGYESTSVENSEWVSLKLDVSKTGTSCPPYVTLKITRNDNAWQSDNIKIDCMGDIAEVALFPGKPNVFNIELFDDKGKRIKSFPKEFTITQGAKIGAAPNPYNYAIAIYDSVSSRSIILPIKGLEKNKPLPASGFVTDRKTNCDVFVGDPSSYVSIPVYQVDNPDDANGKTADFYEHIGDVIISGSDVSKNIPNDSSVEVTLNVDSSETVTMKIFFPEQDVTVEKKLDLKPQSIDDAEDQYDDFITLAQSGIDSLESKGTSVLELTNSIKQAELEKANGDPKAALQHLKEVLRKIEAINSGSEIDNAKQDLEKKWVQLKIEAEKNNSDELRVRLDKLSIEVDKAMKSDDISFINQTNEEVHQEYFTLTMPYQTKMFLLSIARDFDSISWKDYTRASQLMDRALECLDQGNDGEIIFIVKELFSLMPSDVADQKHNLLR